MASQQAYRVARAFCRELARILDTKEIEEVRARNDAQTNPNVCHTHDFCDANGVMEVAIRSVSKDLLDDAGVWNEAWDLAKEAGFDQDRVQRPTPRRSL